ncbi:MAG TPA: hypothetical protein VLQ48_09680 [Chloroflexia bacterium]|nr:hypothetical protein [Chloroflexia bacterium]
MSEKEEPLFQGMDELERVYAPEELPDDDPDKKRVRADDAGDDNRGYKLDEPTVPRPIATVGTSASGTVPSGTIAPPEIAVSKDQRQDSNTLDEEETPNG